MDGLYLLWWVQEKQLSPALVATAMAAGDLLLMGLEFPTGWFADRFGYRRSLILGSAIQVAGMICCWLANGVPGLVIACLLVAVGDAFRSGADQALLYRTCVALDREPEFQAIEARAHAVKVVALAVLVVAGGAIVSLWGFVAGWAAEVVMCACGCVIACAMVEPPANDEAPEDVRTSERRARTPWKAVALVIVPVALLDAAASAGSFVLQTQGGSPTAVTLLVAIITLADAAGAAFATRVPTGGLRLQLALAMMGACVAAAAIIVPATLIPATIALAFATGLAHPLRAGAIQRMATDSVRARAASAASACDMALSTLALLLTGAWLSRR
jgi:MFS family permease